MTSRFYIVGFGIGGLLMTGCFSAHSNGCLFKLCFGESVVKLSLPPMNMLTIFPNGDVGYPVIPRRIATGHVAPPGADACEIEAAGFAPGAWVECIGAQDYYQNVTPQSEPGAVEAKGLPIP